MKPKTRMLLIKVPTKIYLEVFKVFLKEVKDKFYLEKQEMPHVTLLYPIKELEKVNIFTSSEEFEKFNLKVSNESLISDGIYLFYNKKLNRTFICLRFNFLFEKEFWSMKKKLIKKLKIDEDDNIKLHMTITSISGNLESKLNLKNVKIKKYKVKFNPIIVNKFKKFNLYNYTEELK